MDTSQREIVRYEGAIVQKKMQGKNKLLEFVSYLKGIPSFT